MHEYIQSLKNVQLKFVHFNIHKFQQNDNNNNQVRDME